MKLRTLALLVLATLPLVPVMAQPRPPTPTPATTVALTVVRGSLVSVGYRNRDRMREVYASVQVRNVSGPNPNVDRMVALPRQPNPASPPAARGSQPALRAGEVARFVYVCSLDRASPRVCSNARNHPSGLSAPGPVTLTMILAEARPDEVPAPEIRSPSHDVPFISTQGPLFRIVSNGTASSILLGVYNGDPGALTTTPGAMIVP